MILKHETQQFKNMAQNFFHPLLQINYLNDYHKLCREKVGPELQDQGYTEGYDWMMEKSKPYEPPKADKTSNTNTNAAPCTHPQLQIAIIIALIALLL